MDVASLRQSSINTYLACAWAYFLNCVLGIETVSGIAAAKGTIVHAVLEAIGRAKLEGGPMPDWSSLLSEAWDKQTAINPTAGLVKIGRKGFTADYKKCRDNIMTVLDSHLNPYKLNIIPGGVERRFDMPINAEEFLTTAGQPLRLVGTMDLLHELEPETLEVTDWKTGKRKNWNTGEDKDLDALLDDVQPRVYHLCAYLLYPRYKNIAVTFYYIEDGGPFTVPLTSEDIPGTLAAIWRVMRKIEQDVHVRRRLSWRCNKFCYFGRSGLCEPIHAYRQEHGLDTTIQTFKNGGLTALLGNLPHPITPEKTE